MESIPDNKILKLPPGAVENIRKIHDLDKPGRVEEAINILEEWLQKQDHIIKKDFSKEYLEKTLISCKGSVEKSKKQIDRCCTMRTLIPKFFSKTNVKELPVLVDIIRQFPLPKITEDFYRIILFKFKNQNFTAESFMQYYQFNIIASEYIKAHDYVNGFIVIHDYIKLNIFDLLSKMNHVELQQFSSIITECYGTRVKGVLILSESKAIQLLTKTLKQLVNEKVGNRIQVLQTLEDLHRVVPKEILPVEYGGNERSLDILHEEWVKELSSEKHVKYMEIMNKACTDETKRHEGKFNEEYMGMPGAFRNLSVD